MHPSPRRVITAVAGTAIVVLSLVALCILTRHIVFADPNIGVAGYALSLLCIIGGALIGGRSRERSLIVWLALLLVITGAAWVAGTFLGGIVGHPGLGMQIAALQLFAGAIFGGANELLAGLGIPAAPAHRGDST